MPLTEDVLNYLRNEREWIMGNNLRTGDRVRIIRRINSEEDAWNGICTWVNSMDDFVGEIETVSIINSSGVKIQSFYFPYFVLEKVPHTITIGGERFDISDREYHLLYNYFVNN